MRSGASAALMRSSSKRQHTSMANKTKQFTTSTSTSSSSSRSQTTQVYRRRGTSRGCLPSLRKEHRHEEGRWNNHLNLRGAATTTPSTSSPSPSPSPAETSGRAETEDVTITMKESAVPRTTASRKNGGLLQLSRGFLDPVKSFIRAAKVFKLALKVYLDYRSVRRKGVRLKRQLGLDIDDPASDDHPEVNQMWEDAHRRNAELIYKSIVALRGLWVKVVRYVRETNALNE